MSLDASLASLPEDPNPSQLPVISLFTMFRLGLVQMGLGIMAILMLGVLNRIMIQELAIPATIVGGSLAMYQLVAPARVFFGQMSDAKPLAGHHRTGYIWLGAMLFTLLAFVAVQVVWQLNRVVAAVGWTGQSYMWVGLLALTFGIYGLCISATSTPFFALMVDVSDEDNRGKLVGIVWSMLTVGIGLGAGISSGLLRDLTPETLEAVINRLFVIMPGLVLGLVLVATFGVEKKYSRFRYRVSQTPQREDQLTLGTAIKVLTASRQTGFFFSYLLLLILGMFMQQPILEPFAGEVFGLSVTESTALNIFWSLGSLVSLSFTGFWLVPRLGKKPVARLGCQLLAVSLVLVVLSGLTANAWVLRGALVLFGLAIGVATGGSISLMLDLTTPATAGTFTGMWGLSQALSQALSTLSGGTLLDLGRWLFGAPLLAYGLVFGTEVLVLGGAILMLRRVDVAEFRATTQAAIAQIIPASPARANEITDSPANLDPVSPGTLPNQPD